MEFKIYLQADSFQTGHEEQVRRQGYDPAEAFVCMAVDFPVEEGHEPPEELLQAARYAETAPLGDTMIAHARTQSGRRSVVRSFHGTFRDEPRVLRYLVGYSEPEGEYWWLAVNRSSVAACPLSAPPTVKVSPTPEWLIGFPTREEQLTVRKFFLKAPMPEVTRFMNEKLLPRVRSGEVAYLRPDNPEPPTQGGTAWLLGKEKGE
jgi:hypothetical protein